MKRIVIVSMIVIALVTLTIGIYRAETEKAKEDAAIREIAATAAHGRLLAAVNITKAQGIAAGVSYCAKATEQPIAGKTYFVTCSITVELIDPATYKTIQEGNDIIYPVGIVMQAKDGLGLLQMGQKAKEIFIGVYVYDHDPMKAAGTKKVYERSTSFSGLTNTKEANRG